MTDTENRLHDLEVRFGDADKRQESFETFVRAYMKNNSEQMQRMETRMDRIEDRMEAQFKQLDTKIDKVQADLSAQMHNLLVAGGIGFFTVVVTIILTK